MTQTQLIKVREFIKKNKKNKNLEIGLPYAQFLVSIPRQKQTNKQKEPFI